MQLQADGDGDRPGRAVFVKQFEDAILAGMQPQSPTSDETYTLDADVELEWQLRQFRRRGDIHLLYEFLNTEPPIVSSSRRRHVIQMADLDADSQPMLMHQLRRLRQHPLVWDALLAHVAHTMSPDDDSDDVFRAGAFYDLMADSSREYVARTHFDASQVERHMSMTRRVPADVSNLIGQFTSAAITPRAPIPLRMQVKHKLELLTRRVAYLSPAQVAAEMRDILGEVEEALPEDERTLKKARK